MISSDYKLPSNLAADIDTYDREVQSFLAGEIPAAVFKAKRVPRGVYEQRKDGAYMVRVRVAGGSLNSAQMCELAALSGVFSDGQLHVTTRQDVQFHDVAIQDTPAIMRRLMAAGMTSKGGGGNTVRNITVCPYAGICSAESFDVTPFAHKMTEYLISLVGSYNLPRKYKIAFSGCRADCALAQVSDLGFIATVRDGKPGFIMFAGGGMGAQSRIADTLLDWIPATEVIRAAETIRRLFDQHGDRSNKHRARLRFVFERIGVEEFRRLYAGRMADVVREGVPECSVGTCLNDNPASGNPSCPLPEDRGGIRAIPQRQPGFFAVPLNLPLGFLPGSDFQRIGTLASRYSREGGVRCTRSQNLLLRFVKEEELPALAGELRALETDLISPVPLDRFVACAGASTCRLGICLARNAARACAEEMLKAGIQRGTLDAMEFQINGCSNSCGQQPVGAVGCFGMAQRGGARLIPSYGITVGGRCGTDGARFGEFTGKVPVVALPHVLRDLASDFETGRTCGESFLSYFDRKGKAHFEAITARHAMAPGSEDRDEFRHDIGVDEEFSLAGRGAGECGAGVFEVIQEDLIAAKKADTPFDILCAATRALLITRGVDARDPDAVLREFERHFIDKGLVADEFRPLLSCARGYIQGWKEAFKGQEAAVARLRDRVELLYSTLDANLEFHPPEARKAEPVSADAEPRDSGPVSVRSGATAELDLSGVACPMNFVKARLKLEPMNVGESLSIILDDGEPIRNVPASFKSEGQEVTALADMGNGHWRVVIKKRK